MHGPTGGKTRSPEATQETCMLDEADMRLRGLPEHHVPVRTGRVGVLIANLGTPEGTGYWPVRRYLKEFLSDRRVIETNRLVWWLVLNGVILTIRPKRSGHAYARIWNRDKNESPLKTITRAQAEGLEA